MSKFEKDKIPHFEREDCPNKVAEWLQESQTKRDEKIYKKIDTIHMELVMQRHHLNKNTFGVRLLALGLAVVGICVMILFNKV